MSQGEALGSSNGGYLSMLTNYLGRKDTVICRFAKYWCKEIRTAKQEYQEPGSADFQPKVATYICSGPLAAVTAKLFFPLAISMVLSSTIGMVDMYLAGFLGAKAQAAVGLGDQLLFLVIVLGSGLATACSSFVARAMGANDLRACRTYTRASLLIALAVGLLSAILGTVCARPLLGILGCDSKVADLAVPYTAYNSPANTPFVISLCLSAIFRALGRPLLSVYLWISTALLSNLLCLLLFFSGIKGMRSLDSLAVGWNIGCLLGCIFGLVLFKRVYSDLKVIGKTASTSLRSEFSGLDSKSTGRPDASIMPEFWGAINQLIIVGAPVVVAELSLVVSHFLMYRILAFSSESASLQAAWTIKLKLEEMIALIPLMALGMSTSVIVGQNLGAGLQKRAKRACLTIAFLAALAMLLLGTLVSFTVPQLVAWFSSDLLTQEATVLLLTYSAIIFPLNALSSIVCAGMEGAGETRVPMILTVVFQVGAKTGLAYYLGVQQSMHLAGIVIGLCLAQLLMTLASMSYSYWRYRRF